MAPKPYSIFGSKKPTGLEVINNGEDKLPGTMPSFSPEALKADVRRKTEAIQRSTAEAEAKRNSATS